MRDIRSVPIKKVIKLKQLSLAWTIIINWYVASTFTITVTFIATESRSFDFTYARNAPIIRK